MVTWLAWAGALFIVWQVVELVFRVRMGLRQRRAEAVRAGWLTCVRCQADFASRGYPSLGYEPSCVCSASERVGA